MISNYVGNTPLIRIESEEKNELYCKYEGGNIWGSAKDRAALYVLTKLLSEGTINKHTEIIESSSGNMGIALSAVGRKMGLKVTIIIDKDITPINEFLIRSYGANVIKVDQADVNNSYLKSRLKRVQEYIACHNNVFWFNQYANSLVCEAYRETLGKEIITMLPDIDYLFMAISSGGSINGVSQAMKNNNANTKVVAIDIEGSHIFDSNTKAKKRITGIGSSIISENVKHAYLDDYIIVDETESFATIQELLKKEQLFLGVTSGCVFAGVKRYLSEHEIEGRKIVFVSHDRGERYWETFYSRQFCGDDV